MHHMTLTNALLAWSTVAKIPSAIILLVVSHVLAKTDTSVMVYLVITLTSVRKPLPVDRKLCVSILSEATLVEAVKQVMF